MSLREQIRQVYDKHGELTPRILLDEARPESSPLHSRFEWDNTVAGEKYRLHQAHCLITSLRTVIQEAPERKDVREYVSISRPESPQPVYRPVEEAMRDDFMRQVVLNDMRRQFETLKRRYGHLEEFASMIRGEVDAA